jgi:hypothetical protein
MRRAHQHLARRQRRPVHHEARHAAQREGPEAAQGPGALLRRVGHPRREAQVPQALHVADRREEGRQGGGVAARAKVEVEGGQVRQALGEGRGLLGVGARVGLQVGRQGGDAWWGVVRGRGRGAEVGMISVDVACSMWDLDGFNGFMVVLAPCAP